MFARKPPSCATETGIDFVNDQHEAMVVAELAQLRQKIIRRNHDATATLDRFDDNRAKIPDVRHIGHTTERHMRREVAQLLRERRTEVRPPRRIQRAVGKPVVRALERNDPGTLGVDHRRLERHFHCFRARIGKDDTGRGCCSGASMKRRPALRRSAATPTPKCQPHQLPRQLQFQLVRMHVAHRVHELPRLRFERGHDARVVVSHAGDAECRREIDIAIAIDVPHVRARRALPEYRPVAGHERDVAGFVTTKLAGKRARLRAGDLGLPRWQ